jgi:hypothetical protein
MVSQASLNAAKNSNLVTMSSLTYFPEVNFIQKYSTLRRFCDQATYSGHSRCLMKEFGLVSYAPVKD